MKRVQRTGSWRVAGWMATAMVLVASGCDCDDGLRDAGPMMEVMASGDLADPLSLRFGKVAVDTSVEAFIEVRNKGAGPLSVTEVTLLQDVGENELALVRVLERDCQGNRRETDLQVLPAGACARIGVIYAPNGRHASHATVKIQGSDPANAEVVVDVSGEGGTPSLRACVVAADGSIPERACTDLTQDPPFIPTLEFGALPNGDQTQRLIRLFNDGDAPLAVVDVRLDSDAPDFELERGNALPGTVDAGASADQSLRFHSLSDGPVQGSAVFTWLAPGGKRAELAVPLAAEAQGPRLCIEPREGLDFGNVQIGQTRTLPLTLTNCSFVPFQITALGLGEDDTTSAEFAWVPPPPTPIAFAPGDKLTIQMSYTPSADRLDTGWLSVATDMQRGTVPLRGAGAPPECAATRPSADAGPDQTVAPLATVQLDGSRSRATPGNEPLQYVWRVASAPPNGTARVSGSGPRPQIWAELAGDYVIELVVKDRYGCQSLADTMTIHVVPSGAIHVQLTWPQAFGDVDLHYLAPGGTFYTSTDVYYRNKTPDWGRNGQGQADGNRGNDASLDIDELWGNGPENVNHKQPFNGKFKVVAHYYCSRQARADFSYSSSYGPTAPMVKIFVNGQKKFESTKQLRQRDLWEVAEISVTTDSNGGRAVTVTPLTTPVRKSTGFNEGCTDDLQ